jgi:hypothetical protein
VFFGGKRKFSIFVEEFTTKNASDMEAIQLKPEKNKLVRMLQTLDSADKLAAYRFLKQSLFEDMKNTFNARKSTGMSMKEITAVVDEVRQEMYEQGEQYI